MPLLLLDLDNTLIDRAAAFRRWATSYSAALEEPVAAADWLVAADRDGLEARERLAGSIRRRFGLDSTAEAEVLGQERKLHRTGLAQHVAGWVISEGAGVRKPDPRIFQIAAEKISETREGVWMIGDSADADIGGAHRGGNL